MPCPYFEPQQAAMHSSEAFIRLPLFREYNGWCHVNGRTAPSRDVVHFCNHGNSVGQCADFPPEAACSVMRYSVVSSTDSSLELVCIEEKDHAPIRLYPLHFELAGQVVFPETIDPVVRAQAAAFCREYLLRCSDRPLI